ncbi:hypothetical protein Trydic_g12323, partial [Trypoxylus dichotomus]
MTGVPFWTVGGKRIGLPTVDVDEGKIKREETGKKCKTGDGERWLRVREISGRRRRRSHITQKSTKISKFDANIGVVVADILDIVASSDAVDAINTAAAVSTFVAINIAAAVSAFDAINTAAAVSAFDAKPDVAVSAFDAKPDVADVVDAVGSFIGGNVTETRQGDEGERGAAATPVRRQ